MSSIHERLAKVMQDVGAVGKNQTNPQQQYNFRGVDDVMAACHPVFVKHGVLCVPRVVNKTVERWFNKNQTQVTSVMLTVEFDFISSDDGSKVTACTIGEGADFSDKAANKAMSAALKYALVQTLCIPTEALLDESEREHPVVEQIPVIDTEDQQALLLRIKNLSDSAREGLREWFRTNKVPAIEKLPVTSYEDVLDRLVFFEGLDVLSQEQAKEEADE
jgi:hypothetical protein